MAASVANPGVTIPDHNIAAVWLRALPLNQLVNGTQLAADWPAWVGVSWWKVQDGILHQSKLAVWFLPARVE